MKKYTVTQTLSVAIRGDTEAEKDATYAWLKTECAANYAANYTVTSNDATRTVDIVLTWDGEQE